MVNRHREGQKLGDFGLKVVATDYALAHWYCQSFKLDINKLSYASMNRDTYARVKESVCKDYILQPNKEPQPEQAIYDSYYYKQYKKRFHPKYNVPPAETYNEGNSQDKWW